VVPDGALGYLPFEVLSDWDRTRLVERWRVRYAPSLRVLHLLRRRDAPDEADDRRPLLALGGIVYDASADSADAEGSRAAGRRTGPAAGGGGRGGEATGPETTRAEAEGPASTYRQLGYGPDRWQNIPGTLREARALGRVTGTARLLTGPDASEHALHQLSSRGNLDDYRALHFATHGFLVPDAPALSALVLAEVGRAPSGERGPLPQADDPDAVVPDGYLSMREIATLDLDAEFVGLSACRTGLGRIYRGSGAVSLAQAFLRAGAGSVAVSLWSVYDASTSRFMEAVYRRAWGRDTGWAEAIAETKQAFIDGHYGERLRAPRFWAPFVHHGRDAGPTGTERGRTD
jgi:CHAT domain-containing protein